MNAAELTQKLRGWTSEFEKLVPGAFVQTELLEFLATRLLESGFVPPAVDVFRVKLGGAEYRKVRITGYRGSKLYYEIVDGTVGFGFCDQRDVHPEDRPRLTPLYESWLAQGKIKEQG